MALVHVWWENFITLFQGLLLGNNTILYIYIVLFESQFFYSLFFFCSRLLYLINVVGYWFRSYVVIVPYHYMQLSHRWVWVVFQTQITTLLISIFIDSWFLSIHFSIWKYSISIYNFKNISHYYFELIFVE